MFIAMMIYNINNKCVKVVMDCKITKNLANRVFGVISPYPIDELVMKLKYK